MMDNSNFREFKDKALELLKDEQASEKEISLLTDTVINNALKNNRNVEDVVWAILQ